MKVATIVPVKYLHLIRDHSCFLALPPLMHEPGYKEFHRAQANAGKYVILDNGAAEGETYPIEVLVELGQQIKAREIVLPDVLMNKNATLKETRTALRSTAVNYWGGNFMAVAQGRTMDEWMECANRLMHLGDINTIGVPKNLTKYLSPYARTLATGWLVGNMKRLGWNVEIHWLGCHGDPREAHYNIDYIRSIDSCLPVIYTMAGKEMTPSEPRPDIPMNFYVEDLDEKLLRENIRRWRHLVIRGTTEEAVKLEL